MILIALLIFFLFLNILCCGYLYYLHTQAMRYIFAIAHRLMEAESLVARRGVLFSVAPPKDGDIFH